MVLFPFVDDFTNKNDYCMHNTTRRNIMSDHTDHWRMLAPVRGQIRLAMGLAVSAIVLAVLALLVMAAMLHTLLQGQRAWGSAALLLALTFASYGLRGYAFRVSHLAAFALERELRERICTRLAAAPLGFIHTHGAAALAKVLYDDIRDLHVFVADSTPLYARAYAAPLCAALAMLWLDWRLALVAFAVLAGGMAIMGAVMRDSVAIHREYNAAREQVNAAVVEFVQAMPVVRTFDGGHSSFGRYSAALDHYLDVLTGWYRANGTGSRLSLMVLNAAPTLLALLWCGHYWWQAGSLAVADWLAVLLLGTAMAEAIMPYMSLYHMIDKAKISAMRINALLDAPVLQQHEPRQTPQDGSVVFENVSFSYPGRTGKALDNISFTAPAGSFTALVGASGAGKSTVARLIPRFWDADSGSIRIGGADIRAIDPHTLMEHIAFVFQDNFLFSASIADNIRLGVPDADDAAVIAAARAAQAHDFILQLPHGYDSRAGERGTNLSGGQRQRITIARAILQNRPILVLDEATAFTDPENEALLMQALKALMHGKTVLMIAHRLPTIRDAGQILVFSGGKLVEQGRHDALLAAGGHYAELWRAGEQSRQWQIRRKAKNRDNLPL